MRILHVNKYLYRRGGAESYLFDVAELQRQAGHQVAYFGMAHPDNEPQPYARFFPPRVELEPPPPGLRARVSAVSRMVWSPSSRRGLESVLAEFGPDVIHLHNVYHQLSPSVVAATSGSGYPTVMTLHDYKLACPSYQMLDHGRVCDACILGGPLQAVRHRCKDGSLGASSVLALESWLHRRMNAYAGVDAFICPSAFLGATMAAARVFPGRLHVVNHFVDLSGVPPRAGAGSGFAFAGRLSAEKGVDTLIAAMRHLPGASLVIAGDGPARPALEAQARAEAAGAVRFVGRLDRDEVLRLLRASRAVVVPSRWHENQPMIVLEALASSVPVVTTDLGGLPELVEHDLDGLVVGADDPPELAAALRTLADSPDRATSMGAAGRRKVARQFNPGRHLGQVAEVYQAARSERAARGRPAARHLARQPAAQ